MKKAKSYVKFEFANNQVRKKLGKGQKNVHNFNFYKSGIHLDYISRRSAVYIQKWDFDLIKAKEKYVNATSYMNASVANNSKMKLSGVYRLFDLEANDINIDKEKSLLKKISREQNIWEMIINPGDLGINNWLVDKKYWTEILDKNLSKLLKANNLKKDNVLGHFVIHGNTKYPHVHLSFWEKEPSFVKTNGKLDFKSRGAFSKESLERFNALLFEDFTYNTKSEYKEFFNLKPEIWNLRKHIRLMIKEEKYSQIDKDDLIFLKYFDLINNYFKNKKNKTYAKTEDFIKKAIWWMYEYLKNKNTFLSKTDEEYQKELEEIKNKKFVSDVNEKLKEEFLEKEYLDFETQIGNSIIQYCLENQNIQNGIENDDYEEYEINQLEQKRKRIFNLKYLLSRWSWESNEVFFKKKIKALKIYKEINSQKI